MTVHLGTHIAEKIASEARIDSLDAYHENLEEYRSLKYTYVPLPLEKKYVNTKTAEVHELAPQQLITPESSVYSAIEHLRGDPFLLVYHPHYFGYDNSELKCTRSLRTFNTIVGSCFQTIDKMPEKKDEILNKIRSEGVFEIITLADINRRATKESLYPIIAELEALFAEKIKQKYKSGEQIEIIPYLSSETIDRWGQAKNEGLDMHVSEFMTLSEIQEVIADDEELYSQFGFSSKKKFKEATGGLVDLRHPIMHTPRTLVHNEDDLHDLVDRIQRCKKIIEKDGQEVYLKSHSGSDPPWYSELPKYQHDVDG